MQETSGGSRSAHGAGRRQGRSLWRTARPAAVVAATAAVTMAMAPGAFAQQDHAKRSAGPIRIGLALSETTSNTSTDVPIADGIMMAVNAVNRSGGVDGRKIVIAKADTADSDTTALSAVQQLVDSDGAVAVFGPSLSTQALTAAPVFEQKHVIDFGYGSTDSLTENPWFFRTRVPDAIAAAAGVRFVAKTLKATKIGVSYVNDQYGSGAEQIAVQTLKSLGDPAVAVVSHDPGATSLNSQLLTLKSAGARYVIDYSHAGGSALLAQESQQLGLGLKILGDIAWSIPSVVQVAGSSSHGVYFTSDPIPALGSAKQRKWTASFQSEFHIAPTPLAAQGYDSLNLMVQAIKNEKGCATSACIKAGLLKIKNFTGIGNDYAFGQRGAGTAVNDGGEYTQIDEVTSSGTYKDVIRIHR